MPGPLGEDQHERPVNITNIAYWNMDVMKPHVFAGNPLDRGDVYRRDQSWLDEQATNPRSRFLPLWQLNVLIQTEKETRLGWVRPGDIDRLNIDVPPVFLGLLD